MIKHFVVFLLLSFSSLSAGWHDRRAEGWAWYEDPKKERKDPEIFLEKNLSNPDTAIQELEKAEKQLKGYLAVALLNPTDKNIEKYLYEQKLWIDKSGLMSENWQRVVLNHPELNQLIKYPSSQYGSRVWIGEQQKKKRELIKKVKEKAGLFFFYEGENPISQAFVKVAKRFAKKHNLEMVSKAVDGKILSSLPESHADKTLAKQIGVETYPSLFLGNTETKEFVPISYGLTSVEAIENNMIYQFKETLEASNENENNDS